MIDDDFTYETGKFNEAELESAIIELFCEYGYQYVNGEQLHRQYEEVLLRDDLETFLMSRYQEEALSLIHI